jgi:glycosyltransferase involved in cell wall biosynthesis
MTRSLSVVIITHNEEANIGRTLESVGSLVKEIGGEIIVVDSGSTDRTTEIARAHGAKVFTEPWKGYAAQKNSAIEKASGDWILSLDADEEVDPELDQNIRNLASLHGENQWCITPEANRPTTDRLNPALPQSKNGYWIARRNFFLHRWIRHGGFWPDRKLRLFRRGLGDINQRLVHEVVTVRGATGDIQGSVLHHAYPTLAGYIGHMNKYSSLAAEQAVHEGKHGFSFINIVLRPLATFIYNYFFRLGFLDGREGLLLHLYHAAYISWKYAKVWELTRNCGHTSK